MGIGGIPNAITAFLMERRDLGVHTEMFTSGMVDLYEAGVVTGRKKTLWQGKMVGAFALGTQKLYDFLDNNLAVEIQQGRITNDPYIIGQNYKMVSVNTALAGGLLRPGLLAEHRPAALQRHRRPARHPPRRADVAGRPRHHRPALDGQNGTVSTIVPMLAHGAEVTVPSQDVDTVVTEFGVAELKGRSVKERTDALIKVAHPDFRPWLREEVERLGIVPRLVILNGDP